MRTYATKTTHLKTLAFLVPVFISALIGETLAAEQTAPQIALKSALEAVELNKPHEALEAAHKSMLLLTQLDKFHIRTIKLVDSKPGGWGVYTERQGNAFKKGEKVAVYIEPGSFKYERGSDDQFKFGFTVDFHVAQTDGNILGGQQNFGQFPFTSHRPNTEIFLDLNFTLTGIPPGKYILKITVHDMISKESKAVDIPVSFTGS